MTSASITPFWTRFRVPIVLGLATLVSGLAPLFFNVLAEQASGTLSADHVSLGREPTAPLEEVRKIAGIVRDLKG